MIKNVLPSLRQRAGPQRICSRQKSIRSGTARDSFSQPPHMRGKGNLKIALVLGVGITPACAGKSYHCFAYNICDKDHPRMCGEKYYSPKTSVSISGSPPRMRGKAELQLNGLDAGGITPACAGKSLRTQGNNSPAWDHPRMCGEKKVELTPDELSRGSPPHVRGKDVHSVAAYLADGITPACAGKRQASGPPAKAAGDHPRVCGEKGFVSGWKDGPEGSPPRMRGKGPKGARP